MGIPTWLRRTQLGSSVGTTPAWRRRWDGDDSTSRSTTLPCWDFQKVPCGVYRVRLFSDFLLDGFGGTKTPKQIQERVQLGKGRDTTVMGLVKSHNRAGSSLERDGTQPRWVWWHQNSTAELGKGQDTTVVGLVAPKPHSRVWKRTRRGCGGMNPWQLKDTGDQGTRRSGRAGGWRRLEEGWRRVWGSLELRASPSPSRGAVQDGKVTVDFGSSSGVWPTLGWAPPSPGGP